MTKRKAVVISARVHPGETVGSWMMQGVLDFLTDPDDPEAILLRENLIFKIIPMLNPDGVINGNYRCSLAGCDLNRRWKNPNKTNYPTIYNCKKLIRNLHKERGLLLYCDLHGHSRKKSIFMYGCTDPLEPERTRIFPYMLSKISPAFSFEASRFGVQKSKESTARVSLWKEMGVSGIYTMEASFCGCEKGELAGIHFTTAHLKQMGKDLCRALISFSDISLNQIPRPLADPSSEKENAGPLGKKVL